MELDVLPANMSFQYTEIFKDSRIVDIATEVRLVRAVKSAYEIGILRQAAQLSDLLAGKVPELLRPGKTEVALAGELEAFASQGYISDHARIFSIGPLPGELMRAHEAMLVIQEEARKQALPGIASGDIYAMMVAMAEDMGYSEFFMGAGDRKIRFTGHGVGLELDEFPFLAKGQRLLLESGMVIALEPKIILPGKGVVGIENTMLLTDTGLECLSTFDDHITILPL
jgi:Xaa-Pro aminopeptidase